MCICRDAVKVGLEGGQGTKGNASHMTAKLSTLRPGFICVIMEEKSR